MNSPHLSTATTKVIIVRHGRTTYNEQGRYQGSSDESVLTEKGYQDAFLTGLALQNYQFDAIYTSPLTRVQQTTEAIVKALKQKQINPPVYVDPKLTEICMSDWQGLFYQEVKEKYAALYCDWQENPHLFQFKNQTFPVIELFNQAQQFWQKVLNQHREQNILVVAHGGTNRALISTATGLSPEYYHRLQQSNCGISCLEFLPGNQMGKLKYFNFTSHLSEILPKLKAGKTGYRWLLLPDVIMNNVDQSSYLRSVIMNNSINLLFTENSDINILANTLLKNSTLLHLPIPQNYSIQDWQQKILSQEKFKNNLEKESLVTGIIIASETLISQILQETLTIMTPLELNHHLIVIHLPQINYHPILQGILPLNQQLAPQLN
jgi:probable phosphoglycerate mutase